MPKENLEELAFPDYWNKRYEEKKDEKDELEAFEWASEIIK